jgi:hypothetical protein
MSEDKKIRCPGCAKEVEIREVAGIGQVRCELGRRGRVHQCSTGLSPMISGPGAVQNSVRLYYPENGTSKAAKSRAKRLKAARSTHSEQWTSKCSRCGTEVTVKHTPGYEVVTLDLDGHSLHACPPHLIDSTTSSSAHVIPGPQTPSDHPSTTKTLKRESSRECPNCGNLLAGRGSAATCFACGSDR